MKHDYIIIGAGIVGLATARELLRRQPGSRILLLEKESAPAHHQSGHNSGVIHAGVYYRPGSLKARFCREGAQASYDFCRRHGIPARQIGKLVVATNAIELERMDALFDRCRRNGLAPEKLSRQQLTEREPEVSGAGAFLVKESGITDFPAICKAMLRSFCERGGEVRFSAPVIHLEEGADGMEVGTPARRFRCRQLIVCAGLMADRLARLQGLDTDFRIIPYRGEYYRLRPELDGLVSHLIYPVPDPALPFLGVHLTPTVGGSIVVGPNAVQGWKREGYGRINVSLRDTAEILSFPGFWKITARHLAHGVRETWESVWKPAYTARVRSYCPGIRPGDLQPYRAGVRAQAVSGAGEMIDDFLIERTPHSLHLCNAPSPAATSAIPIARHICGLLEKSAAND